MAGKQTSSPGKKLKTANPFAEATSRAQELQEALQKLGEPIIRISEKLQGVYELLKRTFLGPEVLQTFH